MGSSRDSSSPARTTSTQQNMQQQDAVSRSKSYSVSSTRRGRSPAQRTGGGQQDTSMSRSPQDRLPAQQQKSPTSDPKQATGNIKTESPTSPVVNSARPRPRRLDLTSGVNAPRGPQTAGGVPSKDSAGLAIKDLGVACLSPGFQTQDPTMREQLQRSLSVREQQRQLIEARQRGGPSAKPIASQDVPQRSTEGSGFSSFKEPLTARRKGPPAGLSINAPTASSFANERVIQSAPLNQSFTGLRRNTTHVHQPSSLGQTSHIHQVHPSAQTSNRLPPLSDVFANERLDAPPHTAASFRPSHSYAQGAAPMRSPNFATPHQMPQNGPPSSGPRPGEFRGAEDATANPSGGREEVLPKMVHYGGVQPPTPPSPMPMANQGQGQPQTQNHSHGHQSQGQGNGQPPIQRHGSMAQHPPHSATYPRSQASPAHGGEYRSDYNRSNTGIGRRRPRDEYERENGGSPATQQGGFKRHAGYEEGDWRAEMSGREKREEFLRLCERAWDLFHS